MDLNEKLDPRIKHAEMAEELEVVFGETPISRYQIFTRCGNDPRTAFFQAELIKLRRMLDVLRSGRGTDVVIQNPFRVPWNRLPRKET